MQQFGKLLALVLAISVFDCGPSVTVDSNYHTDIDFSSYQTFAWIEKPQAIPGSAQAAEERDGLLAQRIKSAVDRELMQKGLRQAADNPQLLVVHHYGAQDKVQVTNWGYRYSHNYWGHGGKDIEVHNYAEGALMIDLIDGASRELVWRGTARSALDQRHKTPEEIEKRVNKVVEQILSNYPPKK